MKTLLAGEYLKDSPPLYEEIFPEVTEGTCKQSGEVSRLLELREEDSRTYFTREKECVEGRGEYRGELDWKGRRSGQGKMVWGDKVYVGDWVRDTMDGQGMIWGGETGSYYSGGWRRGTMHGQGKIVYGPGSDNPGDVYQGEFR